MKNDAVFNLLPEEELLAQLATIVLVLKGSQPVSYTDAQT